MRKPSSLQKKTNFCLLKQAQKRNYLVNEKSCFEITNLLYTVVTMWKMLSSKQLKKSIRIFRMEVWIWMQLNLGCNTNLYNLEEFNHPISKMLQKKVVLVKKDTKRWQKKTSDGFFGVDGLRVITFTHHCWLNFFLISCWIYQPDYITVVYWEIIYCIFIVLMIIEKEKLNRIFRKSPHSSGRRMNNIDESDLFLIFFCGVKGEPLLSFPLFLL